MNSPNNAPYFLEEAVNFIVEEGGGFVYTPEAFDDDGDVLKYYFTPQDTKSYIVHIIDNIFGFNAYSEFNGNDSFILIADDGKGGTASQLVNVEITPVNDVPLFLSNPIIPVLSGETVDILIPAFDADGDLLTYIATNPQKGTLEGGSGGSFSYTAHNDFVGSDSFVVTADDGNGGISQATIVLAGSPPTKEEFRLFAPDNFEGGIAGYGTVFGTAGFQRVEIVDEPGSVTFDPSFNKGGDIVRFDGGIDDLLVAKAGSSATFTDGDTFFTVPLGTTGTAVAFDGSFYDVRTAKIDVAANELLIGDQIITDALTPITASPDDTDEPFGDDSEPTGRLLLNAGAEVHVSGNYEIFGSEGVETVNLSIGRNIFDPSFNKGGDTIVLQSYAEFLIATRSGSSILLGYGFIDDNVIPVGITGATIAFENGRDPRTLIFDQDTGVILLGDQIITSDPVALMAAGPGIHL